MLMLIFAIVAIGVASGWLANLILGGGMHPSDWGQLVIAGFAGSFVGGMIGSLVFGGELELRPSGLIGSTLGAIILLTIYDLINRKRNA